MDLTKSQQLALDTFLGQIEGGDSLLSLSGAAGTGKTTLIDSLVERLAGLNQVTVCTPTNKAAQVLQTKGIDAATFFKKFYILEGKKQRGQKPRFISCRKHLEEIAARKGGRWEDYEPLLPDGKLARTDVLIIDEASLVTSFRIREMQKMCRVLILVGDHNQLPPVGDQEYPAGVFGSLRHSAELTEIMRQDEGSMILALANELRAGGTKVDKMLSHFEPQESFVSLVRDGAQMIAFTNKERQRINHVCRRVLGFTQPYPQPGDRMVVTNNFDDNLINGTVVEIADFIWDQVSHLATIVLRLENGRLFSTRTDLRSFIEDQISSQNQLLSENLRLPSCDDDEETRLELTWAYCLTAHKAQGSEWDKVVVFDQRGLIHKIQRNDPRAGLSPDEYVRRWTYTAITRARKHLYVAPTWFAQSYGQVL